jgi:hypothetical protein
MARIARIKHRSHFVCLVSSRQHHFWSNQEKSHASENAAIVF